MAKKKTIKPAKKAASSVNKKGAKSARSGSKTTPKKSAGVTLNTRFRKGEAGTPGQRKMPSLAEGRQQVGIAEAVRERLRLHPLATDQEIAAMLDLDGAGIATEEVARIRAATAAPKTSSNSPRTAVKKRARS